MPVRYPPKRGSVVLVDFGDGFVAPEMRKRRLCVVVSPPFQQRVGLCTVVPLSRTPPDPVMPYHCEMQTGLDLGKWGDEPRWLKGDMVYATGLHRVDLVIVAKDQNGRRRYQTGRINAARLADVERCVAAGLGLIIDN